jgi:hypothetical protein
LLTGDWYFSSFLKYVWYFFIVKQKETSCGFVRFEYYSILHFVWLMLRVKSMRHRQTDMYYCLVFYENYMYIFCWLKANENSLSCKVICDFFTDEDRWIGVIITNFWRNTYQSFSFTNKLYKIMMASMLLDHHQSLLYLIYFLVILLMVLE